MTRLEQIRAWLAGGREVRLTGLRRAAVYAWVERALVRHENAGLAQLTTESKYVSDARFSPDGQYIAYVLEGNIFTADWMVPASKHIGNRVAGWRSVARFVAALFFCL